jgi:hypothetical protein
VGGASRSGWRFKYRFAGKEKLLALGVYPEVSLDSARGELDDARKQLRDGIDQSAHRKATKATTTGKDSFEVVAREWHAKRTATWTESTAEKVLRRFETDIFPWLAYRPTAPELLTVLRRIGVSRLAAP